MADFAHELSILAKFAISVVLGFAIGIEREYAKKPAGMRTSILIAASATMLTLLGVELAQYYASLLQGIDMRVDPLNVIQAIIVGISFIGAGMIIKHPKTEEVMHLTTAAGILMTASIGIAVALAEYYLAVGATLLVIFINYILKYVEEWLVA